MPDHPHVLVATLRGQPQIVAFTPVAVNTHKIVLLSHCRAAWNIPNTERQGYHFLVAAFSNYFQNDE